MIFVYSNLGWMLKLALLCLLAIILVADLGRLFAKKISAEVDDSIIELLGVSF